MTDNQSVLLVNSPICRLCQKVYQDPKILSCLHSFCDTCLTQLHTFQVIQSQLTCPVCDVDTDIPPGGISCLTNNAFLNRISQDYIEAVKSTITRKPSEIQYGTGYLDKSEEKVLPDEFKKEVSVIFDKLQSELHYLQEEALRTTYSIEKVTDIVTNWKQQNSEIKSQIKRRSEVLQHLIRSHEAQMIAQLANQQYTDKFTQDIETAKSGLKHNLKNTIQAIEFIKQVQEFATEQDVLDMREFLLGKLATLNKVSINYKQYYVDFQDSNIAEIIADDFGQFGSSQTHEVVFDPIQSCEVKKEQDVQENMDEKNVPRRLRFRRKMNKERRLTSVVDKNWRADEPQQATTNPLTDLRENLIHRRRSLLKEYVSFDKTDSVCNIHQSLQTSEIKKKKRRYHSFGGRSADSVAPPDAAMLRQINEHIQPTPEKIPDVKPTFLIQTSSVKPMVMKEFPLSMKERSNKTLFIVSPKLLSEKENSLLIQEQTHTTNITEDTAIEAKSASDNNQEDKQEEEEWTVVTEEVVVQQSPPPQSNVKSQMSWDNTQRAPPSPQQVQNMSWDSTHSSEDRVQNTMSWESTHSSNDSIQKNPGDNIQKLEDSMQKPLDKIQKPLDKIQKPLDTTQRSLDTTHRSLDTTQRSLDTTQRSEDSAKKTMDRAQKYLDSTQTLLDKIETSKWSETKDEHVKTVNVQSLNEGNINVQNGDPSDSEWTFTEEEISVVQPTLPKSPSQNVHKSLPTNTSLESTTPKYDKIQHGAKAQTQEVSVPTQPVPHGLKAQTQEVSVPTQPVPARLDRPQYERTVNKETIQQVTRAYEPQRPAWNSQFKTAERVTRSDQEETFQKQEAPEKRSTALQKDSTYFPKRPAMAKQSSGDGEVKQTPTEEWQVTTEEVSVPSNALSRSSVMQEDRETRLKFLRNNWRKRKDVLRQTEGFVAPMAEKEKKMPTAVTAPADSNTNTEKSVQFKSNLGLSIRSALDEEKHNTKAEEHIETVVNGSRSPNDSKPDRLDDVFSTQNTSSGTRLTKDVLHEYRQNMRQKTERWRVDSN